MLQSKVDICTVRYRLVAFSSPRNNIKECNAHLLHGLNITLKLLNRPRRNSEEPIAMNSCLRIDSAGPHNISNIISNQYK